MNQCHIIQNGEGRKRGKSLRARVSKRLQTRERLRERKRETERNRERQREREGSSLYACNAVHKIATNLH